MEREQKVRGRDLTVTSHRRKHATYVTRATQSRSVAGTGHLGPVPGPLLDESVGVAQRSSTTFRHSAGPNPSFFYISRLSLVSLLLRRLSPIMSPTTGTNHNSRPYKVDLLAEDYVDDT